MFPSWRENSKSLHATRGKTVEQNLFPEGDRLFERLCEPAMLRSGFNQVKRNKGAPGVDRMTISEFEENLEEELSQLSKELAGWTYKPKPVRLVEIDKPGSKDKRKLGIPCIRDRVVDATMKILMEPILLPTFSDRSYGFIPGRNQKQAIQEAQRIIESGKEIVVDIDLSKFFDRIHQDRLIHRLGLFIEDKRILRLVGIKLRSGIMKNGLVSPTLEGTVQGSPLSPLLSNVVLDELDKELESRGLEFCRFADDCNIFVKTRKAGERVMASVSKFIENRLKLKVNEEKSQVAPSRQVKFLGMTVIEGTLAISQASLNRAMAKVKQLTPRGAHERLEKTIERINLWYQGWVGYYSMTQYPAQLAKIEAHIRRRLRARLVDQQKSQRNLFNKLQKRGVPRKAAAKAVYSNDKRWVLSNKFAITKAYPNRWFIEDMGQLIKSTAGLLHWLDLKKWIRLM